MEELNDLLKRISETITRLDELKEQSPDVREALALLAKQEQLVKRLQEGCKEKTPHYIPYPVPAISPDWTWRPQRYDWWNPPYKITVGDSTASTGTLTLSSGGKH